MPTVALVRIVRQTPGGNVAESVDLSVSLVRGYALAVTAFPDLGRRDHFGGQLHLLDVCRVGDDGCRIVLLILILRREATFHL